MLGQLYDESFIVIAGYGVVDLENIEPGTHRLKIMHNRDQCGPRRKLFFHFTIDDS